MKSLLHKYLVLAVLLLLSWPLLAGSSDPRHPNVLLVVVDDLGLGDLPSFYPQSPMQTPTMDTLAAAGTRFTRFYTDSTCSTSRAALLTGQHPARLGFHPVARGISPDVATLGSWFKAHGYSTHHIGKWHAGEFDVAASPQAHGFDTTLGFASQWLLGGPDETGKPQLRQPGFENPWLSDEKGSRREYTGYLPDILTDAASDRIEALSASSQPWLIFYATLLPHTPLHWPPGTTGAADDRVGQYHAMVQHLDGNIARLLQALDKTGQRDNTLIVLLSDNGAPEKLIGSNAGFAGGKSILSEGGVRAPLLVVDPARPAVRKTDDRAVTIYDVFPTLAARIHAPLDTAVDGLDWNATDADALLQRRPLFWLGHDSLSMLTNDKRDRLSVHWLNDAVYAKEWQAVDGQQWLSAGLTYWLHYFEARRMLADFAGWLAGVERVAVQYAPDSTGRLKIAGNDFLRTPLKDWAFYMRIQSKADTAGMQKLVEQPGIWSMQYDVAAGDFLVSMHGLDWRVHAVLPAGCHVVGLNADLYDRYTNANMPYIRPSNLRLSVDGVEVARTQWTIENLAGLPIDTPTLIGSREQLDTAAAVSPPMPVFLSHAHYLQQFPFEPDEKHWRQDFCSM